MPSALGPRLRHEAVSVKNQNNCLQVASPMLHALRRFLKQFKSKAKSKFKSKFKFMSDNVDPRWLISLLSEEEVIVAAGFWSSSVLGVDLPTARQCYLTKLKHCKARSRMRHEFLIAYFSLPPGNISRTTCLIIDRNAAVKANKDGTPPSIVHNHTTASLTSVASSLSSCSTGDERTLMKALLGEGGSLAADDRVILPKKGDERHLREQAVRRFGKFDTLNTLTIPTAQDSMTAAQLATLLTVVHKIAPHFTLAKYQCYWYALIIFLVVRNKTTGQETHGDSIVKQGKLWFLSSEHNAGEDEAVAEDDYEKAWARFKAAEETTPQDPEDVLRLAITELEEAKTNAEEMARRKAAEFEEVVDEGRRKALALEHEVQKLREMLNAQTRPGSEHHGQ